MTNKSRNFLRCLGVAHACGSALNDYILTYIGKVITRTTAQYSTEIEVKKTELQQLIRDYHASIHAEIVTAVVTDSDNDNVFVYNDDPIDPIKDNDSAYYGF